MHLYRYTQKICTKQNLRSTAHGPTYLMAIFGPPGIFKLEGMGVAF